MYLWFKFQTSEPRLGAAAFDLTLRRRGIVIVVICGPQRVLIASLIDLFIILWLVSVSIYFLRSRFNTITIGSFVIVIVPSAQLLLLLLLLLLLYLFVPLQQNYDRISSRFSKRGNVEATSLNTLRTGDADLRFYITTVQDG